jgi:hypothetical protein
MNSSLPTFCREDVVELRVWTTTWASSPLPPNTT